MILFNETEIWRCYEFARQMRGKHNPNMIMERSDAEIFRDDFRGKLGEIALRKYITSEYPNNIINTELDFNVTPRGQWDIVDMVVNNRYISIKSIKHYSNFFMIETKRFNPDGSYAYVNNDNNRVQADIYALVKVKVDPDIRTFDVNLRSYRELINTRKQNRDRTEWIQCNREINAEIVGGISHQEYWKNKHFAPKGIRCSVRNLRAICGNIPVENLPDRVYGNELRTEILQQNNYIMDAYNLNSVGYYL